ncbi:MAG: 16S rRNA (adenine(1518)-N(6)/adenine(1519)-N(6))-dimethyltransferase, partial [Proteobacteria bacterium]|nr:16S rRNA (adenine(1518)-N(6)/adenine(1519)-N(6))-dimethyltransferase [Pseudomonadota bacterium]
MNKHRPRKRFGQHFLTDPGVVDAIVNAISPQEDEVIVEIGAGSGAITVPLARRCGSLHAVELDRDLAARLRTLFQD